MGLALICAACAPRPEKAAEPAPAPAPPSVAAPIIPQAPPPLSRAELLRAAAEAASAYASGKPVAEAKALEGRRFSLKLPFGCGRAPPEEVATGYAYDAKTRTLRLRAKPETWTETDWVKAIVGSEDTEAIEGFWVRRPWMAGEGCPAWAASAPAEPASPETLGLAQVFAKEGSRVLRRGARGYQATVKRDPGAAPGPAGLRLVLEGRIGGDELRGPIRCRSESPNQRPVCLTIIELDRVAFETPDGEMLAEWRS